MKSNGNKSSSGLPSSRRRRVSRLLYAVLLLALVVGIGYWFWGREDTQADHLNIVPVQRGDVEETVTALGNLQPRDYVDVGAQVSGQLRRIHFNIGDRVEKGALLAEIDATVQQTRVEAGRAQLLGLRAQLAERQAQRELAEHQFQRQKRLKADQATSEEAFQASRAAVLTAAAQIDALKAQIQQTESTLKGDEATLGYTQIYAPMSGTVVSLTARQGQTLNANQQAPLILQIADLSTMTVRTQVSEADVSKLRLGMEVYFTTLGAPDRRWRGQLRQILPTPEVLNNVVLYTALFDVANPTGELMTQMSAQVFFLVAQAKDVLNVPVAALRPLDPKSGRYQVKVALADDRVEAREVRVGVTNRVSAEILSGLNPGDRIVTGNARGASSDRASTGRPTRFRGF